MADKTPATKATTEATTEATVPARALVDIPQLRARCGDLVDVPESLAKSLADSGQIDVHESAVAYAKAQAHQG